MLEHDTNRILPAPTRMQIPCLPTEPELKHTTSTGSGICNPRSDPLSEIKTEHQTQLVNLLIWAFARLVLVLIIEIEFGVLADRKNAACIKSRIAPLTVLALIKGLGAGIRR